MSNHALSSSKGAGALPHKVVIRNLPANLPESIFWSSAEPYLVTQEGSKPSYNWRDYHAGKLTKSKSKGNRSSTAYVNFESLEDLVTFHANYNNHVFQDKQGNLTQASVEFAPFQKTPKMCKPDPRQGTIEKEPEYIAFLESLNPVKAPAEEATKEAGSSGTIISGISNAQPSLKSAEGPKQVTPLVEHLKSQGQRTKPPRIVQNSKAPADAPTGPKSMEQKPQQSSGGKKPPMQQLSGLAGKAKERHQKESNAKENKGKGKQPGSAQASRSSTPAPKAKQHVFYDSSKPASETTSNQPPGSETSKADDKKRDRKPPKGSKPESDKPKAKAPKQQQSKASEQATESKSSGLPPNKPPQQRKAPSRAPSAAQAKTAPSIPVEPMPTANAGQAQKADASERPRARINNTDGRNNRLMGGLLGQRPKRGPKSDPTTKQP